MNFYHIGIINLFILLSFNLSFERRAATYNCAFTNLDDFESYATKDDCTIVTLDISNQKLTEIGKVSAISHYTNALDISIFASQNSIEYLQPIISLFGLQKLTSLTLDFSTNQIVDVQPIQAISQLPKLIELKIFLGDNQISDLKQMITKIASITTLNLLNVNLKNNKLQNIAPFNELKTLINLYQLQLYFGKNYLIDMTPVKQFETLINLNVLELDFNSQNGDSKISDIEALSFLSNLSKLMNLALHFNQNSISSIAPLSNLKNLSGLKQLVLNFGENFITDIIVFSQFEQIQKIEILNINLIFNQITDTKDLQSFQYLTAIQSLSLELWKNKISDLSFFSSYKTLINCQSLEFDVSQQEANTKLSDISAFSTLESMKSLTKLTISLSENSIVDTTGLSSIATLVNLQRLTLQLNLNQINSVLCFKDYDKLTKLIYAQINLSDNQIDSISPLQYIGEITNFSIFFCNNPSSCAKKQCNFMSYSEWKTFKNTYDECFTPLCKNDKDCPNRLFCNIPFGVCQDCDINSCQKCQSKTQCKNCFDGYQISDDKKLCQEKCTKPTDCQGSQYCDTIKSLCMECELSNCAKCDSKMTCSKCDDNYYINKQQTCSKFCTRTAECFDILYCDKESGVCLDCDVQYCSKCFAKDQCQLCDNQFYLDDNKKCQKKCQTCEGSLFCDQDSGKCQDCEIDNCAKCDSSTTCLKCGTKYELSKDNKVCEKTCTNNNDCAGRLYCNPDTKRCEDCNLDHCTKCDNADRCTYCEASYRVNEQHVCQFFCTEASQCSTRYFCETSTGQCGDCGIKHCIQCQNIKDCQQCETKYTLEDGKCVNKLSSILNISILLFMSYYLLSS